jgi:hypothetical protein
MEPPHLGEKSCDKPAPLRGDDQIEVDYVLRKLGTRVANRVKSANAFPIDLKPHRLANHRRVHDILIRKFGRIQGLKAMYC